MRRTLIDFGVIIFRLAITKSIVCCTRSVQHQLGQLEFVFDIAATFKNVNDKRANRTFLLMGFVST